MFAKKITLLLLIVFATSSCHVDRKRTILKNESLLKNINPVSVDSLVRISSSLYYVSLTRIIHDSSRTSNRYYYNFIIYRTTKSWMKSIITDSVNINKSKQIKSKNGLQPVHTVYFIKDNAEKNIPFKKFKKIEDFVLFPSSGELPDKNYQTVTDDSMVTQFQITWDAQDVFSFDFLGGSMSLLPWQLKQK